MSRFRRSESVVNRVGAFLEWRGFFILIHWFSFVQIHLHLGSFDKMLTVCKYYVGFD